MLDSSAIMNQVRAGVAPPTWKVMPAKGSHFITTGLLYILFGLAMIGGLVYLFFSNTLIYFLVPPVNDGLKIFWFLFDNIVGALLAIGGFIGGIKKLAEMGSAQQQAMVLMPEGFLMQTQKAIMVHYGQVAGMTMALKNGEVILNMRRADNGKTMKVTLDGRFGATKPIGQAIVQAQGQYAQVAALAQQHQG